jgi:hypothetical protein
LIVDIHRHADKRLIGGGPVVEVRQQFHNIHSADGTGGVVIELKRAVANSAARGVQLGALRVGVSQRHEFRRTCVLGRE